MGAPLQGSNAAPASSCSDFQPIVAIGGTARALRGGASFAERRTDLAQGTTMQ